MVRIDSSRAKSLVPTCTAWAEPVAVEVEEVDDVVAVQVAPCEEVGPDDA